MKIELQFFGGRGSSGSRAEKQHAEYLRSKNLNEDELDEYDEQVLNDFQNRPVEEPKRISYNNTQVNNARSQANKAIKSEEEKRMEGSLEKLQNMLTQGDMSEDNRKKLQKSLSDVRSALYSYRKYGEV